MRTPRLTATLIFALSAALGAGCDDDPADPDAGAPPDAAPPDAAAECIATPDCDDGERCVDGRCEPDDACICPAVIDPVCGDDGVTYDNACEAACADAEVEHDGACAICDCGEIIDPVCGADGTTYDNACFAECAGVDVTRPGRCEEPACGGDTLCPDGAWCDHPDGCGEAPTGTCMPRPDACPEVIDPVCGCDGVTYGNACEAHAAGMGVASPGACETGCGGLMGLTCGDDDWCDYPEGCGFADQMGVCEPRPDGCDDVYLPVCGCDGETYGNECEAHRAGVDVNTEGPCGECAPEDCGPAPGVPNVECDDGTIGGPTGRCLRGPGGLCTWEIVMCPDEPIACGARLGDTCAPDEYCDFDGEFCDFADATGLCRRVPDDCPDVFDPVCGCDGMTYDSPCRAQLARVDDSVRGPCDRPDPPDCADGDCGPPPAVPVTECDDGSTAGPTGRCLRGEDGVCGWEITACPPAEGAACDDNRDCAQGDYCRPPAGLCLLGGTCATRPDECFLVLDPVCGCDGVTYDNACEAERAGVGVRREGECPAIGLCLDGDDCEPDEYCARDVGACGLPGECVRRPIDPCPDLPGRVCGCDGVTYDSACAAAAAGASVDTLMACPGADPGCEGNADCAAGEYCARPLGACDAPGECARRPEACAQIFDPVCGCDGRTYGNACSAASAGMSVAADDACDATMQ